MTFDSNKPGASFVRYRARAPIGAIEPDALLECLRTQIAAIDPRVLAPLGDPEPDDPLQSSRVWWPPFEIVADPSGKLVRTYYGHGNRTLMGIPSYPGERACSGGARMGYFRGPRQRLRDRLHGFRFPRPGLWALQWSLRHG
jgi:hypothetical protein